jgi:YegS/Rv2252/BmrU family lipid kinase
LKILLLANANAGTAETRAIEKARATLEGGGADVECEDTGSAEDLERVLSDVGDRMLVVAGGDGSIHHAVKMLHRKDPRSLQEQPIGLIPLGTGNDLAKGVGIPTDPVEAAKVVLTGRARLLDLIVTDHDDVVVNAAHAGLGAEASAVSAGMKASLGPLSYPLGALIAGVREAAWDLHVSVDGRPIHEGRTLMVGIANAPCIGNGTSLCPLAKPDDGLLDVVVVSAGGPAARISFGVALRTETHLDRDDVRHIRGTSVSISGDRVAHVLDGELLGELRSCVYTVRPGAWNLITPPPVPDDG